MAKILVVGIGRMGFAHAKAAAQINDNEIIGLVSRDISKWPEVTSYFPDAHLYNIFSDALTFSKPDAVLISSYTDTHAPYAIEAMEAGCDVFVEKPLALNMSDADDVIQTAKRTGRKLIIGYILRHHPLWNKFISIAKTLTGPFDVTFTCNQHSTGEEWQLHKNILEAGLSPLVDAGIHYVDVMSQITSAAIQNIDVYGAKTQPDITVNHETNMTIDYDDDSKLYFESGFGPGISPDDISIMKVAGQGGYVEILPDQKLIHNDKVVIEDDGSFYDQTIMKQQQYFFENIDRSDMEKHWQNARNSLELVLSAEKKLNNC